mgnify:CR=1 FL=1|jgi:hypothetical protein
MKIKLEFTVEVKADVIQEYMTDLNEIDQTKREFVQDWIKHAGVADLEGTLKNNGFGYNAVRLAS